MHHETAGISDRLDGLNGTGGPQLLEEKLAQADFEAVMTDQDRRHDDIDSRGTAPRRR